MIRRFFRWLEAGMYRAEQSSLERYLSGAKNIADVERMIREWNKKKSPCTNRLR